MTDDGAELPEEFGEGIDWSVMEHLANNGGSTEGATPEEGPSITVLTQAMLTRRVLWDTVPCDEAMATIKFLHLPMVSEDVEDTEHKASHQRLEDVGVLAPIIMAISMSATQAIVASMFVMDGAKEEDNGVESEEFKDAVDKMHAPIFAATLASVAEMLDVGLIHTPHILSFRPDDPNGPTFTMGDSEQ